MAFVTVTNPALADELEAIDSIYGQGTIKLTSSNSSHTSIELRLPGEQHAFLISFPAEYPAQAPSVTGIDSLQLSLQPEISEALTYLRSSVVLAYSPGQVCLFDLIEKYVEISEQRQLLGSRSIAERNHKAVIKFDAAMKTLAQNVRTSVNWLSSQGWLPQEQAVLLTSRIVDCAVCLEPVFNHYAATLLCKHSFCVECLQDGLGPMMAGSGEFKCCGSFIPAAIVDHFGNLERDLFIAYKDWLKEASSNNPLYCHVKTCSTLIPSYLIRDGHFKCTKCGQVTCLTCRGKQHVGVCGYELRKITNMAKANQWKFCPKCSHLVERTTGCNHMTCVCGARFCYRCAMTREKCACGG